MTTFLPNFAQIDQFFFPLFLAKYGHLNTPFYFKFNAELKSFYRIMFDIQVLKIFKLFSARSVKINCKTQYSKKAYRPKIEIWENLKKHFSTYYGLHAGNNQNSI
jgi:hypothetical protein